MDLNYNEITADDGYTILFELGDGTQVEVTPQLGGGWAEGRVVRGEAPWNWGGKTYQGYLTPYDVLNWLQMDYDYVEIVDVY